MDVAVLNQLADIETAAENVLGQTAGKKAELAKAMNARTAEFDKTTDADSARQIAEHKDILQKRLDAQLQKLQDDTDRQLSAMDARFRDGEDEQADAIVRAILK
jgi:hypothetical protein